jgi:hypothetical protein
MEVNMQNWKKLTLAGREPAEVHVNLDNVVFMERIEDFTILTSTAITGEYGKVVKLCIHVVETPIQILSS